MSHEGDAFRETMPMRRRDVRAHVHRSRPRGRRRHRPRGRRIHRRRGRRARARERARRPLDDSSSSTSAAASASTLFLMGHPSNLPVHYETTHRTPPPQKPIKTPNPTHTSPRLPQTIPLLRHTPHYNHHHTPHHIANTPTHHPDPSWRRPAAGCARRHIDVARQWRRVRREPRRRPKSCTTTRMISFRCAIATTREG